ncbi:MAG: alpha/beta hydrolase, partial [Miltoncostaeaceae bacterium]
AARVARGERADDIVCVRRADGPSDAAADAEVWTYRTWWGCHGDAAHTIPSARLAHVGVPILIVEPDDAAGRRRGNAFVEAASGGAGAALEFVHDAGPRPEGTVPAVADAVETWLAANLHADRVAHAPPAPRRGGTGHQLVTLVAEDATEHDGLLHHDPEAEEARGGPRTAMLHVHGNQGNLTVGTLRFLPDPVVEAGVGMLVVETRLANASQLVGHARLPDALLDLAAGADWLLGEGYERIVISGYSLGATLAVRFATANPPWLAGLVTFGADWSMPDATRSRMTALEARPSYEQLVDLCHEVGTDGPVGGPDDPLVVVRRAFGASPEPRYAGVYTARTWWASRGPEAVDAEPGRHIAQVHAPILLVQGTADRIAEPVNADRLAEEARQGGNDSVRIASIEGVGHSFHGGEQRVADAVTRFLGELG